MGKAALLFVAATFIGAAVLMHGQQKAALQSDKRQSEYQQELLARQAAEAGLNMAMSQARRDFDTWRAGYNQADYEGGSFDVNLDGTAAGPIQVTSVGSFGDAEHQAKATLARLAPSPAALIIDADTAEVLLAGNNFLVTGKDTRPASARPTLREGKGAGTYADGVWTHSIQVHGAFQNAASGSRIERLRGTVDEGNIVRGDAEAMNDFPISIGQLVSNAQSNADEQMSDGSTVSNRTFGAPDDPQIVYAAGSVVFQGTVNGYGLLVVNGDLSMGDDFMWEGLVVARSVEEEMNVAMSGDATIYGALILRHGFVETGSDDDSDDEGDDDSGEPCHCPEPPSGPPSGTYPDPSKPDKKVLICHVPPGNPANAHTISISQNAHSAHLQHHDDYDGPCLPACSCGTSDASQTMPTQTLDNWLGRLTLAAVTLSAGAREGTPHMVTVGGGIAYLPTFLPARFFGLLGDLGCEPDVSATFSGDGLYVTATSTKDLSNVVLEFADGVHQKFEGLSGNSETFSGTGGNAGKIIVGVWIKSGCNQSGDGPGYGEYVGNPDPPSTSGGDQQEDEGDEEGEEEEGGEETPMETTGLLRFQMSQDAAIIYSTEAIGKIAARLDLVKDASWIVKFDQIGEDLSPATTVSLDDE